MNFASSVKTAITKYKKKAKSQGLLLPVVSIVQTPASEVVEIDNLYEISRYPGDYTIFDYSKGVGFSGTLTACIETLFRWKGLNNNDDDDTTNKGKKMTKKTSISNTKQLVDILKKYAKDNQRKLIIDYTTESIHVKLEDYSYTIALFPDEEDCDDVIYEICSNGGLNKINVSSVQQVINILFKNPTCSDKKKNELAKKKKSVTKPEHAKKAKAQSNPLRICPDNYLYNFLAGQIPALYTKAGHRVIEVVDVAGVLPVLPEFQKHGIMHKAVSDFVLKGKYLVLVDKHLEMYDSNSQVVTEYVDQSEETGLTTLGNRNPDDFALVLNRDIVQLTRSVVTNMNLSPKEKAIKLREIADELEAPSVCDSVEDTDDE